MAILNDGWRAAIMASAAILGCAAVPAVAQERTQRFDIPAQQAAEALNDWARQAGQQIVFPYDQLDGRRAPQVRGNFTPRQALERLIAPLGLVIASAQSGTVTLVRPVQAQSSSTSGQDYLESGATDSESAVADIVVTGTNIRGVLNSASPVVSLSRRDIQKTGLATTEQVIQTLPQNFSGGINANSGGPIFGGEDSGLNLAGGTAVNLRGFGSSSTLVLVNGHRLAPAGLGNYVDLSMIPLAAIDRLEVLTDGASSVYGSDAVAGVVNVRLRRDFDGLESRLRYGTVTEGSQDEVRFGQVAGKTWQTGSAMLSYDFYRQSDLDASERSVSRRTGSPVDLIPSERRHSAFASVFQSVGSVELFADGLYSHRRTRRDFLLGLPEDVDRVPTRTDVSAQNVGGTLGAKAGISRGWILDGFVSYNASKTDTSYRDDGLLTNTFKASSDVFSAQAKLDGGLFSLAGGEVKAATGVAYRREGYESVGTFRRSAAAHRDVTSVFGELFAPLLGSEQDDGLKVEFSASARYEKYSDFGSTFDPKAGIVIIPTAGMKFRGTIGSAFRAPIFTELDNLNLNALAFDFPDPMSSSGSSPTLYVEGGRSTLQPEKARTWTAGFDFQPTTISSQLLVSATYFNIDFKDRIATPITAVFSALGDPIYQNFVIRNPGTEITTPFFNQASFRNLIGIAPEDVQAFIDNRLANTARRKEDGVDFLASWNPAIGGGQLNLQISGTVIFTLKDRIAEEAPTLDVLDTIYFPASFRMRNSVGWSNDRLSANLFMNYTDGYRDNRELAVIPIGSWTTFDTSLTYNFGPAATRTQSGMSLTLSAQNLFDRKPPYVVPSPNDGLEFDAANANPRGRFVTIELVKRW